MIKSNNDKSNHLRKVQKMLEEAQKEAKRLEQEARLLKVKDKLQIIFDKLTNCENLTIWLEENTKIDAKILANTFADNFDLLLSYAGEELEDERFRRERVNEKRNRENAERRRLRKELEERTQAEAFRKEKKFPGENQRYLNSQEQSYY